MRGKHGRRGAGGTGRRDKGREMFTLVWHGLKLWATQFREINSQWAHLHSSHHTRTRPVGDMVAFKCSVLLLDIGAVIHIRLCSRWIFFFLNILVFQNVFKKMFLPLYNVDTVSDILTFYCCAVFFRFSHTFNHHKWNLEGRKLYLRSVKYVTVPILYYRWSVGCVWRSLIIYPDLNFSSLQQPCMDKDLSKNAWWLITYLFGRRQKQGSFKTDEEGTMN